MRVLRGGFTEILYPRRTVLRCLTSRRVRVSASSSSSPPHPQPQHAHGLRAVKQSLTDATNASSNRRRSSRSALPPRVVKGDNKPGLGHTIAKAVGDAGINMAFIVAQVVGRKYSAVFGFENESDANKAAALIKEAAPRSDQEIGSGLRRQGGQLSLLVWSDRHLTEPFDRGLEPSALSSDVLDMVKWDWLLLGAGLLPAKVVTQMTTPPPINGSSHSEPSVYGFGPNSTELYGRPIVMHGGRIPGFNDVTSTFTDTSWSISVMSNIDVSNYVADVLWRQILDAICSPSSSFRPEC